MKKVLIFKVKRSYLRKISWTSGAS